ncbi:MAG: hypothetical protein KF758_16935 [Anaerolineales bacterium]|nr:hypothetical protein [Anaerolineales bacterium]
MLKFIAGLGSGIVIGYVLGLFIPIHFFIIVCLIFLVLLIGLLILFHFGVRDFQDY